MSDRSGSPLGHAACDAPCPARRVFLREAAAATLALTGLALMPWSDISALSAPGVASLKYPIPAADGVFIDKANEVILVRTKGEVIAFALSCPHQNTALRALPGTAGFQCPRHKSKYTPDGTFLNGKATRNMDRLQIAREGGDVVVNPDVAFESDTEPAKWSAALVKV